MPQTLPIRAAVFDLDDTLYPEREYVRSGYRFVASRLAASRPGDRGAAEYLHWLWQRFLAGRAERAFDALSEHFELGLSPEEIGDLVTAFRGHSPRIRPWRDMADLVERLQEDLRLGLLSDGYLPTQRLKLDALGLAGFFEVAVFTEELGRECWKPSPAGFEMAAERLGAPHERCAYVADNPAKDFIAPNALGWRTIQLRRAAQVHADTPAPEGGEPHYVAHSAADVRAALLASA